MGIISSKQKLTNEELVKLSRAINLLTFINNLTVLDMAIKRKESLIKLKHTVKGKYIKKTRRPAQHKTHKTFKKSRGIGEYWYDCTCGFERKGGKYDDEYKKQELNYFLIN